VYYRPTKHELLTKLKSATLALQEKRALFANPSKVVGELSALNIGDSSEVWNLILNLLKEIQPKDYKGKHPPERSYEKTIKGKELFAFLWWSPTLKKTMYLKFALIGGVFWYVSLHADKFSEEVK